MDAIKAKKILGEYEKDADIRQNKEHAEALRYSRMCVGAIGQIRFERDLAIEQLEELGYSLGEKIEKIEEENNMTIKEIRELTGLTQAKFGEYYNIPLSTIKKWESSVDSPNYRECPAYVKQLLEKAVRIDFHIR